MCESFYEEEAILAPSFQAANKNPILNKVNILRKLKNWDY